MKDSQFLPKGEKGTGVEGVPLREPKKAGDMGQLLPAGEPSYGGGVDTAAGEKGPMGQFLPAGQKGLKGV